MSQKQRILTYLYSGRTLTSLQALKKFNCWRLSGRIAELRDAGIWVKTEMILTKTGKNIARYSL